MEVSSSPPQLAATPRKDDANDDEEGGTAIEKRDVVDVAVFATADVVVSAVFVDNGGAKSTESTAFTTVKQWRFWFLDVFTIAARMSPTVLRWSPPLLLLMLLALLLV
jgi:hypothetical protein